MRFHFRHTVDAGGSTLVGVAVATQRLVLDRYGRADDRLAADRRLQRRCANRTEKAELVHDVRHHRGVATDRLEGVDDVLRRAGEIQRRDALGGDLASQSWCHDNVRKMVRAARSRPEWIEL